MTMPPLLLLALLLATAASSSSGRGVAGAAARSLKQGWQGCSRVSHATTGCRLSEDMRDDAPEEQPGWPLTSPPPTSLTPEPLNPAWSYALPCPYGELPGTWLPHISPVIADFNNEHHTLVAAGDMGIAISNTTHGGGWQVFHPNCQLHNYLHDFLMLKPSPVKKDINVLTLGDSVDRHPIVWYGALMELLHNRSDGIDLPPGYTYALDRFFVRSGAGLNVYYQPLYAEFHHDHDDAGAVQIWEAAQRWARSEQGNPAGVQPDVIMLNAAFWDLHDLGTNTGNDQQQMVLRPEYLRKWMNATSKTLKAIRQHFPNSYIVWRGAPQTRVELETGAPGAWHKEWAFKMHIAQINAAARHVTKYHGVPFIDVEMMGAGMTPAQADYDIHHPRDFFAMAYYNVMLNLAVQYLQKKETEG